MAAAISASLRVDRFFLPEGLRRDRLGSRLLAMAEEEGGGAAARGSTLNTLEIQAPGFYQKQGYEMAATLDCDAARRHPLSDDEEMCEIATS